VAGPVFKTGCPSLEGWKVRLLPFSAKSSSGAALKLRKYLQLLNLQYRLRPASGKHVPNMFPGETLGRTFRPDGEARASTLGDELRDHSPERLPRDPTGRAGAARDHDGG
jgi:hypothetical protein